MSMSPTSRDPNRLLLIAVRRAILMIVKAIDVRLGLTPGQLPDN